LSRIFVNRSYIYQCLSQCRLQPTDSCK